MLNYRPKMFDESSDTNTSKELFFIICSFVVVFMLIRGLNAIAPAIALSRLIKQEEEISSNDPRVKIPYLFGTVLGIIVAIIYCRFLEHRPVRSMGVKRKGFLVHYLSGTLAGAALMSSTILMTKLTGTGTVKLCENINYKLIVLYLLGFCVQGMSEEFVFRGYFMNSIGGAGHHTAIAVGVSAAAFGISHGENYGFGLLPLLNIALFGVLASLCMILFENIWGISAIHSIWNFTQGNVYGISVSGTGETESILRTTVTSDKSYLTGGKFGMEGSIFTTIALGTAALIVFLLILGKAASAKKTPEAAE